MANSSQGIAALSIPRINEQEIIKRKSVEVERLLKDDSYSEQHFPEQILIAKLGFENDELDKDKLQELKDRILKLSDAEFQCFWNYYGIRSYEENHNVKLQGGTMLDFDRDFRDGVLARLIEIGRLGSH